MNSCNFVGRLVRDPELKTTTGGHSLCRFTIAVDRDFKNAQGEYEADFISCTAWRGTAEFIEKWFKKGDPISITGSLQIRKYQAQDGTDRWAADIQVDKARFVPGAPKREQTWQDKAGAAPVAEAELDLPADDDVTLPFDL